MPNTSYDFDAATSKLARADKHLDDLKKVMIDYSESKPAQAIVEPAHYDGSLVITTKVLVAPPSSIRDILGDFLNNVRSALDTSLFPILEHRVTNVRQIQFIISKDRATFEVEFDKKLRPYLNDATVQAIESVSPFKDGNPTLYNLAELSNYDKHRFQIKTVASSTMVMEELESLLPLGTPLPNFSTLTIGEGGSLRLHFGVAAFHSDHMKPFLNAAMIHRIPAMVTILTPSDEQDRMLYAFFHGTKLQVQILIQNIINANS